MSVLFRLGDTSWRKKNQIGLYEMVLEYFYFLEDDFSEDMFYAFCYENGVKQKEKPSKRSDVVLLLKTLRLLNLIEKNEKKFLLLEKSFMKK